MPRVRVSGYQIGEVFTGNWFLKSGTSLNEFGITLTITIGNPSSTDKIRNPVLGIRNPRHGIQNPSLSWTPSGAAITLERSTPTTQMSFISRRSPEPVYFRHISQHFFLLKWNLRSIYERIRSSRFQNRKLNVFKGQTYHV